MLHFCICLPRSCQCPHALVSCSLLLPPSSWHVSHMLPRAHRTVRARLRRDLAGTVTGRDFLAQLYCRAKVSAVAEQRDVCSLDSQVICFTPRSIFSRNFVKILCLRMHGRPARCSLRHCRLFCHDRHVGIWHGLVSHCLRSRSGLCGLRCLFRLLLSLLHRLRLLVQFLPLFCASLRPRTSPFAVSHLFLMLPTDCIGLLQCLLLSLPLRRSQLLLFLLLLDSSILRVM